MSARRLLVLIAGPCLIVAAAWALTKSETERAQAAPNRADDDRLPPQPRTSEPAKLSGDFALEQTCRKTADRLLERLPDGFQLVVRAPFVVAGDLPPNELDRYYYDVILPTKQALATCYFDRHPAEPIVLVLCRAERSYSEVAEKLDGRRRRCYSGYYARTHRRVVINAATGNGTIAHELTHALTHCDFPTMPEWFDEGLASLHEESEFSRDGLKLTGLVNWRLQTLQQGLRKGDLPSLETMMTGRDVRGDHEAVTYAQSRFFCLYLQRRGLLAHYYRKFRATAAEDATGRLALRELLHTNDLSSVDADFRRWAMDLRS